MEQFTLTAVSRVTPANVTRQRIDTASGLLADENCDVTQVLPFITGSEPRQWAACSRTVAFEDRRPQPSGTTRGDGVRGWLNRVLGGSSTRNRAQEIERGNRNRAPRSLDDSNR